MIDTSTVQLDTILKFKKKHPCGSFTWKVIRLGIDMKLECTICKRVMTMPRIEVAKKAVSIESEKK